MKNTPYLSLCIPTNGILEWVIPVLESIYSQHCDEKEYEIIITDNGTNLEFKKIMDEYASKHHNFIYKKTDAVMFLNQIEAFKLANGDLIKFINHRMPLLKNSLKYFINFVKEHLAEKPIVYFSNGMLKSKQATRLFNSFDDYVRNLSYWSSWSAGTAIWKKDFEKLDLSQGTNYLFPHTDIVFFEKNANQYLIDDTVLLYELPADTTKKGSYDIFNAFLVEYPHILEGLYVNKNISLATFEYIKRKNSYFVAELYLHYVLRGESCSYNLDGYQQSVNRYYGDLEIRRKAFFVALKDFARKIVRENKISRMKKEKRLND